MRMGGGWPGGGPEEENFNGIIHLTVKSLFSQIAFFNVWFGEDFSTENLFPVKRNRILPTEVFSMLFSESS